MWNIRPSQRCQLFSTLMPENGDDVGWWRNQFVLQYFWRQWNGWHCLRSPGAAHRTMAPDLPLTSQLIKTCTIKWGLGLPLSWKIGKRRRRSGRHHEGGWKKKQPEVFPSPFLTKPNLPDEQALESVCSQVGSCGTLRGKAARLLNSSHYEIIQGGEN